MDQITHIYTDMELATLVDQYGQTVFPSGGTWRMVYRLGGTSLFRHVRPIALSCPLRDGVPIP
ncbi:MAG: hypothetical protein LKE39_01670 [Sphaerochaeta sp.]|nr:hypothetical protein [Sphaerochaeta sp.]